MIESTTRTVPPIGEKRAYKQGESIISAISAGFFFILLGSIYVLALPNNLFEKVIAFFGDLTVEQLPGTSIYFPAPINSLDHGVFYTAVFQFCLGLIVLQVLVLLLRLVLSSSVNKTAETLGNLVFWSGTAWLATTFLSIHTTVNTWFVFWAGVLTTLGVSLIARALVLLLRK